MIINEQVSKAWNAFLQARANVLHSARDFLPLGLIYIYIFGILSRDKAISGYKARADWLRCGDILSNVHSRVIALRCEKRVFCVL